MQMLLTSALGRRLPATPSSTGSPLPEALHQQSARPPLLAAQTASQRAAMRPAASRTRATAEISGLRVVSGVPRTRAAGTAGVAVAAWA